MRDTCDFTVRPRLKWCDSLERQHSLFMIEKEKEILVTVLKGLRLALSIGFSKGTSDSYMDAIDAAMVAIQNRLRMLAGRRKSDSLSILHND